MKLIHIVALAAIGIGIAALTMQAKDVATYANFSDAQRVGEKIKVAGKLSKDKPMNYDPVKDPNQFTFYLTDQKGQEIFVRLMKPKPQDFELSEQVVVTGEIKNNEFIANEVLMKCPSKYKDEEIYMKKNNSK